MAGEEAELIRKIESALMSRYGNVSPESMRKLFDAYDGNRDGRIEKEELKKLLYDVDIGNGVTRGAWANGIIDKLDKNGDRAISWEEFQAVVR